MLNSMDIAKINSEEISNLQNLSSSLKKEGQIIEYSDGQFVILQMENCNELYAVPCSNDLSENDILNKLTKDGFLVEERQVEKRIQEPENIAEDVLNEFLQSNPAAPMQDEDFILSDDLTNFNFIQEFDLNNPSYTLPTNDHNILDNYMDQSKHVDSSSSKNPVYLDFNMNTNSFIKQETVTEEARKIVVSGSNVQKENKTRFTNRVIEKYSTPKKTAVIPDFFNSKKPITTVYRKPLHTKISYKLSLIDKEEPVKNEVETLFKRIDTKDIKVPVIDDFPRAERMRKQKFQKLLYPDCCIEFEDSSPKNDLCQPITVIKTKKSDKKMLKIKREEIRDSTSSDNDEESDDEINLAELAKKKSQKCEFCSKFFKTVRSLDNHKKDCEKNKKVPVKRKLLKPDEEAHPKKRTRKSIVEEVPKLSNELRCDICNKNFRQKSYLIAHLKTHELQKPVSTTKKSL